MEVLGTARRVTVTKEATTIVDGAGEAQDEAHRVAQIQSEIEATDSDWDREKLQEGPGKLAGAGSRSEVGAATQAQPKERNARVEAAAASTRAALEERIVAGRGPSLLRA